MENDTAPSSSVNWLAILTIALVFVVAGVSFLAYQNYQLSQNASTVAELTDTGSETLVPNQESGTLAGLIDGFETATVDTGKWTVLHENAVQEQGTLQLISSPNQVVGIDSAAEYSLQNSSVELEIIDPGLWEDDSYIFTFGAGNTFFSITGGNLYAFIHQGEDEANWTIVPFSPAVHQWLKISWDDANNIYWEYSSDGVTWLPVRTATATTAQLTGTAYIGVETNENEVVSTFIADNFSLNSL